ncbi:FAD synthetase family protein [Ochrobactrum sp. BTU2]|uniref:FAD synthetase family protein n=1 Tax=Ochrobactrum sp. BTU2 TaxID=2856166 RepID=UPI00211A594E|nr:FAD synthetase family protein [Ochrobactrum sp. BTU2]MCQ9147701.1 FAD synthetase family protein [Ochrobactrum sp. BTU2]
MFIESAFVSQSVIKPIEIVRNGNLAGTRLARGVIALGNFDGFHLGHQFLISKAQQIAGQTRPVAIMSVEPHPRQFFNPNVLLERLALPEQKHRTAEMLGIDYIFEPRFDKEFASLTPDMFVSHVLHQNLDVSHVIVGENFRFGAARKGDCNALVELAGKYGVSVDVIPLKSEFSSTRVREALSTGDLNSAERCLGRTWEANIVYRDGSFRLAEGLILPKEGRYILRRQPSGAEFIARLTSDGRVFSPDIYSGKVHFIARLSK